MKCPQPSTSSTVRSSACFSIPRVSRQSMAASSLPKTRRVGVVEAGLAVAAEEDRQGLAELERAVVLDGGPGVLGLGEVVEEDRALLEAPDVAAHAVALVGALGHASQSSRDPPADERRGEKPLVVEAKQRSSRPEPGADERRGDVEGEVALDPFRGAQADQKADPAAPVVADELDALKAERVQGGEDVPRELRLQIARAGRLGPAQPAQIGADHVLAGVRQRPDQAPPQVPVLRPAVQTDHGIAVARARLGDVDAQPPASTNRCSTPSTWGKAARIGATLVARCERIAPPRGVALARGEGTARKPARAAVRCA